MNYFWSYKSFLAKAKESILHQDEAVERLAVILYYHLKSAAHFDTYLNTLKNIPFPIPSLSEKPETVSSAPIFILGKTGSGKTHLVQALCKLAGVNFLSINVTHLSNAGYKGMTLAEVGLMLQEQAGDNLTKQLFSVVFFDEFDKLFMPMNQYQASFQRGIATELLTLMEGTSAFPVKDKIGIESQYMLFILGGSFGLHQNHKNSIGFINHHNVDDIPNNQLDLLKMGFFEELAGRIGQTIQLSPLNKTMLIDILKYSPTSPFVKLQKQLQLFDNQINISEQFINHLIDNHQQEIEKFGVRGLYQAFNSLPEIHDILQEVIRDEAHHHYFLTEQGLTKEKLIVMNHVEDLPF